MRQLSTITLWALLLLPLTLSPLIGLLTPYVALLFIIPLFVVTIVRGDFLAAYDSYTARAFLLVFAIFAIICVVTADSVSDTLRAFNFTMLLAYGAIVFFIGRRTIGWNPNRMLLLAASGVLLGFLAILVSAASGSLATSSPKNENPPLVGLSSSPSMLRSVDLPQPDGPMTATNSPASISRETPCRARVSTSVVR